MWKFLQNVNPRDVSPRDVNPQDVNPKPGKILLKRSALLIYIPYGPNKI
jgi:hypothetical protein